jgi:hypothetical protein
MNRCRRLGKRIELVQMYILHCFVSICVYDYWYQYYFEFLILSSLTSFTATRDMRIQRSRSLGTVYAAVHMWAEINLGCPVWSVSVSRSGILCGCDDGSVLG